MKKYAKLLALLLAVVMVVAMFAGCGDDSTSSTPTSNPTSTPDSSSGEPTSTPEVEEPATYTYNGALSTFPTLWNVHTYETATDAEILDYIVDGFYTFDYNETEDGYAIVPGMVTDEHPVDVTADYVGQWGIEEGDEAQVYVLNLRDDLKWEDGTPITAYDFVESAKRLLAPEAQNYRADSLYSGNMVIHNAQLYLKQGQVVETQDNDLAPTRLTMADLTKGDDGVYRTPQGEIVYIGTRAALDWCGGNTLGDYVDAYGEVYFDLTDWAALEALNVTIVEGDEEAGVAPIAGAPLTDESYAYLVTTITGNPNWGETEENVPDYLVYKYTYSEMPWEEVGMTALSDTELVIAIDQPLEGFYLKYALTSSWLVKVDLYDSLTSVVDGVYTNTYGTSVETTASYGPYKLTSFQADKQYILERNDNYYGYTGDNYQTTHMVIDYVPEATTRLELLIEGKLDSYGLTVDDMATYQMSDYTYYATGDSTFAMCFNPDMEALTNEQAASGENINKTIITVPEFRMAMSFALDRNAFCLATSPLNAPAFGLYSSLIVSDPDNGTAYRTTEVAKNVLADFWGVSDDFGDGKLYADLDEAVESITGYNLEQAKQLFDQAYDIAIANGLMDEDDKIEICIGTPNNTSAFYNNGYEFLVNNYTEAVVGTKLEGKLTFTRDDTLGNGFADALKNNTVDLLFGVGWTGSALDPYGLMEAYVKPSYQYDDATDFTAIMCTIAIDGVEYTASVWDWYTVMAGQPTMITDAEGNQVEYSCGTADEDPETRLAILGALEGAVLMNYNFIPMMDDASATLKGQQISYYTEDYIFGMGFGGLEYYTYNYTDAEWEEYVASQGGMLDYT